MVPHNSKSDLPLDNFFVKATIVYVQLGCVADTRKAETESKENTQQLLQYIPTYYLHTTKTEILKTLNAIEGHYGMTEKLFDTSAFSVIALSSEVTDTSSTEKTVPLFA